MAVLDSVVLMSQTGGSASPAAAHSAKVAALQAPRLTGPLGEITPTVRPGCGSRT